MTKQIVVYGVSGLVARASKMFIGGAGSFEGVSLGGIRLAPSKDAIRDKSFRLHFRCSETDQGFEIHGYGSQSFMKEASLCAEGRSTVRIATRKMEWQRQPGKTTPHEYVLEVELLEE